jgi:hypothetical protein
VSSETKITKARRLTFQYKDTEIKLLSQYELEKILPPSDLSDFHNKSGVWYEITDGNQNVLYAKGIQQAIQTDLEIFSNEPNQESIIRQKKPKIEGTFSILIPELPEAKNLSLYSNPLERGEKLLQKPAIKIFEMNLGKGDVK